MRLFLLLLLCLATAAPAFAHDTWVETNTNVIRTGDAIYIDLKLGNHGNEHRDFKLASKIDIGGCKFAVLDDAGKAFDLIPEAIDNGYAPKEGYWTAKYAPAKPGLYTVTHSIDQVASYAPTRSIKCAKAYFVVSDSLDRLSRHQKGFDRPVGHDLELVPTRNPVVPMGPGEAISVRLLFEGKPLADTVVSFIPRGTNLKEGFDSEFERKTDADGMASFTPKTGNMYLVVAHHQLPRSGANFTSTKYSATLCVFVPEVCPCCLE